MMEPICCPETLVRDYQRTLRNIPEQRRSQVTLRCQNPTLLCSQYEFHRKFQCIFESSGGTNAMSVGKCTRTAWLWK